MKDLFQWLVYSSKNPQKWSLTIKGAGVYVVQYLVPVLAFLGYAITGDDASTVISTVADLVEQGLNYIGTIMVAYGAIRKVWITMFKR